MGIRHPNGFRAIAGFLAFALVQISLQLSFAAPSSSAIPAVPQGLLGRITVRGNSPISINGNTAATGDTVTTGSIVETPSGTEATIDVGPLGTVELASATRIRLDYECPPEAQTNPDPERCKVKVTLLAGCVVTNYRQGSRHQIVDERQSQIAHSDSDRERRGGGVLRTCSRGVPAGAVATTGGIGKKGLIAIVAAAIIIPTTAILIAAGGDTPSPGAP
ncbi:MAG: hypothetical protein AABN95_08780 [Acidobacteriota bacterium]